MLDHVSIQCADAAASAAFYDAVLAPLGGTRVLDFGEVIGYGVPPVPDFWIGPQVCGNCRTLRGCEGRRLPITPLYGQRSLSHALCDRGSRSCRG
jgi:catechol 2,3-dioxygenase-like lactoylglutathione lyase family enzyme